jgi:hypothetical protein
VKVYYVCFLKFFELGDVVSGVGNGHLEQVAFAEEIVCPDDDAFPNKLPHAKWTFLYLYHMMQVRLFVANQHLCIYANAIQGGQ